MTIKKDFSSGNRPITIDLRGYPNTAFPYTILKTIDKNEVYQRIDKSKFYNAIKNEKEKMINFIKTMGIDISPQKEKELRDRQKKNNNPLELKP